MSIIHISAYRFLTLNDLDSLRESLLNTCVKLNLKGTILLSPEGINVMLAGDEHATTQFKQSLQEDARFSGMLFKESSSDTEPYDHMWVKLKKEIIPSGTIEMIPTQEHAVSPQQLKEWLDEGRELTLLDVRNDYEVKIGTFKNAVELKLKHFRFLPESLKQLDPHLKEKPVITFCTGGIRCEKALPALVAEGFKEVYQLSGGILNYFEKMGGSHYEGECFVFDKRVAVNEKLEPTGSVICTHCSMPVTVSQQALPSFVPDISCLYCVSDTLT